MGSNKKPRVGSLSQDLDRRVNNIINRYIEETQSIDGKPIEEVGTNDLVDYVQNLDYSMKRKSTQILKASIRRVLPAIKQGANEQMKVDDSQGNGASPSTMDDNNEDPDMDGFSQFDDLEAVPTMEVKDTNSMNKFHMKLWNARAANVARSMNTAATTSTPQSAQRSGSATPNGNVNRTDSPSLGDKRRTQDQADQNTAMDRESKRKRRANKDGNLDPSKYTPPSARFADMGGIGACEEEVRELVIVPLKHSEIYRHLGIKPPRGILLHGPPGCGKTFFANAIAGEAGVSFLQISAPSIVSGMSGESEKKLREVFEEAKVLAPCIVFIDEIDAITPKRENAQREMERRIVAQMLTCIDDLSNESMSNKPVILIGATNRPDSLDPALRRAGRFDREIAMSVPDDAAREQILKVLCKDLRLSDEVDMKELAKRAPGYVGADLMALVAAAGMIAVRRIFHSLEWPVMNGISSPATAELSDKLSHALVSSNSNGGGPMNVDSAPTALTHTTQISTFAKFLEKYPEPLTDEQLAPIAIINDDFIQALKKVQPSAKREGFATVPDVTWDDIGALSKIRDELRMAIVEPIRNPEVFAQVGITAPAGVLLWGPPGNGKTLLAKAIANESHTNFISVKGGELMSKYVGDSEKAVRQVFARARASSPCVIFFDELDALCSRRGGDQSEASARVVNTLLTEIDGMDTRKKVYVVAATNRPDIIDPAMLRPGRLDKLLYVELPSPDERADIIRTLTQSKRTPLADDVDIHAIAHDSRCDGFSGADLAGLIHKAAEEAVRAVCLGGGSSSRMKTPAVSVKVTREHFELALSSSKPSVSKSDMKNYEALRKKHSV